MEMTRREALQLSSGALAPGVAGCLTSPSGRSDATSTTTHAPEPTTTATTSPTRDPQLRFAAEVLQQASPEAPARVAAHLTNTEERPVSVGYGPTLLFTDDASDELDWARDVVLVADTYTGPNDEPSEPTDGCWRFPGDGYVAIQSSLEFREIPPGESLSEQYSVYTRGRSSACLPEGTYRYQDEEYFEEESRPMILTLVVRIDENGRLSAETAEPVFP
jgi:hypothetical protein